MQATRHPEISSFRAQRGMFCSASSLAALGMPAFFGLVLAASTAHAANGINITRGADSTVYGNCVPSLVVENKSAETIDYLQVDVVMALDNGQERTVELKSAYREGVLYPIAPGGKATLKQHLDTSKAIGAGCGEVKARRVVRTLCEAAGGRKCASSVSVQP